MKKIISVLMMMAVLLLASLGALPLRTRARAGRFGRICHDQKLPQVGWFFHFPYKLLMIPRGISTWNTAMSSATAQAPITRKSATWP